METKNLAGISLGLNLLLIAAIIYLFVKVGNLTPAHTVAKPTQAVRESNSDSATQVNDLTANPIIEMPADAARALAGKGQIYFVNSDTLLTRYGVFKKSKAQLEARGKRFEQDMQGRLRKLQNEFAAAQQKAQSGQLTQTQGQELEQQLMQKQQQLSAYKEEETGKLVDEEKRLSDRLNSNIQKFMKIFGRQRGYTYVLGYTSGGGILYASDSLDITDEVVRGLNGSK